MQFNAILLKLFLRWPVFEKKNLSHMAAPSYFTNTNVWVFNRPGVAGDVLETPLSLID